MRWLDCKYPGQCKCGCKHSKGDKILEVWVGYVSNRPYVSRRGYAYLCKPCGEQHQSELAADDFDERQYASQYGGY